MKNRLFIYISILIACSGDKQTDQLAPVIPPVGISAADPLLKLVNGVWYYADSLFSGHVHQFYENGNMQSMQCYYLGREEGWLLTWYMGGQKETQRFFRAGEKDSTHMGWWENGQKRFEYHFKQGAYDGNFKEWYSNGALFRHIEYKGGQEIRGKGWRETGKLYMSFEVKNGRRYGLMNAQPCYTVKNEKGEYIEVKKLTAESRDKELTQRGN